MRTLTKDDIRQLDEQIDRSLGSEALLTLPRDVAVMNLLRYFEDYCRIFALPRANFDDSAALLKHGQDAMQFAVKWIYEYCPNPTRNNKLELDFDAYRAAAKLHEAAISYSTIWDLMAQLHRGAAIGERGENGVILLSYADQDAEVFDTCSHLFAAPDAPNFQDDLGDALNNLDPAELLREVDIHRHHSGRIKYLVPDTTYARIAEAQRTVLTPRWELGANWNLGSYKVEDFREFWVALLSICWIHNAVCFFSGIKGGALESVVKAMSVNGWQSEIVRRSGLEKNTIAAILDDLTYDARLYTAGNKQADVTSQPFFCLRGEFYALSNQLVMLSNAERNLWDLVSIKRPEIHSRVRNEKERLWLGEIRPRLEEYRLRSFGPIKFDQDNRQSDLDLLVIDDDNHFGLGLQLKWLNHPDRIRDVKYLDVELEKGLDQSELACRWLNSKTKKLSELTGLTRDGLEKYEFRTAVLSKNSLGSSSTIRKGFPVLTERLLDWVLGETHHRTLRTLWSVGEERRYMPKRGEHFSDADVPAEFGGVRFLGKRMGMTKLRAWDPSTDVDLRGLDAELQYASAAQP